MAAAVLAAGSPPVLSAQHVFEVSGGGSSLYDAYGGVANFWGPRHDGWVGVGYADGLRIGAFTRLFVAGDTVRLGNEVVQVRMPTDLFTPSPNILAQGAGYALARGHTQLRAFVGASAIGLNSPYFSASRGSYPMAMLDVSDTVGSRLAVRATAVTAKRQTLLAGLDYVHSDSASIAASGGVGANRPYAALSATMVRPWFRVRGSYAYRSPGFRRAEVPMPNQVETERENVELVLTPSDRFQFGVERKHYVVDSIGTAIPRRSTGNAVFATGRVRHVRMNGGVYFSSADSTRSVNSYASVGRHLGRWLDVDAFYLRTDTRAGPSTYSLIGHFREQVSNRLRLLQQVTYDGRNTRVSFGGNLLTGVAELDVGYQVYYLPLQTGSPFRTVLSIQARIQLGKYATSVGTTVLPDGSVGYSASGSTFLYYGNAMAAGAAPIRIRLDRFMIRGQVVDETGAPVEGAALMIGDEMVFTDSRGEFFLRTASLAALPLSVAFEDFLLAGYWTVQDAPARVQPAREAEARPVRIVLRRSAPPAPAPAPADVTPPGEMSE